MAIKFDFENSTIKLGLDRMQQKLGATLGMYASIKAEKLEEYMKLHRPWTDRTGKAKASLTGKASMPDDHTIRITLAQGVEYGIWLELANEKNFAIIGPTVNTQAGNVFEGANHLIEKIVDK